MESVPSVILPEEAAPPHAAACQLCELSRQRQRVVWGEGRPDAPLFILMDNPGLREDREGRAFVCGTRDTLQIGLRAAGIDLDRVYVSYLLKCRPVRAYDKPAARAACSAHLERQLTEKSPRILLGLGNVVAQALLPDQEAEVKNLRGSWQTAFGLPAAFSYHPLAVRRRPVLMKYFIEDLKFAAARLREEEG